MGKSHQRGWVVLRGRKWYGYYRRTVLDPIRNEQKVDVIPIVLGPKSELTKFQARERGAGGHEANGNGFGKQSHERWLRDVRVVRAQPIFPVEGSELEA